MEARLSVESIYARAPLKRELFVIITDEMGSPRLDKIEDAEAILHLEVEVGPENRARFFDFCRRAFPVYESIGGTKMALYEDKRKTGYFDEVAYYRTIEDFQRSEDAIRNDPTQSALIKEWRSLLKNPPKVTSWFRSNSDLTPMIAKKNTDVR